MSALNLILPFRISSDFSLTKAIILGALLLFLPAQSYAVDIQVLNETTIDSAALTFADGDDTKFGNIVNGRSHQQFPIRTYRGYQYATYYDDDRQVCVGRRKLPDGAWEVIRFTDYNITSQDAHNTTVIGICENDGTIHLAFDHHRHDLNYRVSVPDVANDPEGFIWSTALFGSVTDTLGPLGAIDQVTYPRFISMPNGNLMLYYRYFTSGNGDGMIRVYDGTTSQWQTTHGKFIDRAVGSYSWDGQTSTRRYAYINGISYAGNRLHCSWVWRDLFTGTSADNQHDLCYAYSDDDGLTWKNSAGTQIATTGTSAININSTGIIVHAINPNSGLSNNTTHYAYPDGSLHTILRRNASGGPGRVFYHHWRDAAGGWNSDELTFNGERPEIVGDDERNLFIIYRAGTSLRIHKGVPNVGLTAWTWSLIYNDDTPPNDGEPQIDLPRWQDEGTLSVYHQEEPPLPILDYGNSAPFDGNPSPMRVTDFHISQLAAEPSPGHESIEVALSPTLEWTAGLDATANQVYFGANANAIATATTADTEYQGQQASTTYTPTGPLLGGTTYYWRIDTVEPGNVIRTGLVWSFTTEPEYLSSVSADASVKEDLTTTDESNATTRLGAGGSNPWVDRCTIYVFQLPDLGTDADPFKSANFRFNYEAKQGTLKNNDLYGLGRRASATVLGSDYYGQTSTNDPSDATKLQTDILNDVTPLGEINTSTSGDTALLNYLNIQYDSGAGIGQYVFLRLNTSESKTGINRATLTMSEGSVQPRIEYATTLGPIVTMVALGSPADLTDGNTWSDGNPAGSAAHYVIPDTGNLRSETGTSTFPGLSLTVEAGGKFQFRAKDELGEVTTVDPLIATGGTSSNFVNLSAGTGTNTTNYLAGTLQNDGYTKLVGFGNATGLRNIRISSLISGDGTLRSTGTSAYPHTCTIDNMGNTFSGLWESNVGTLVFTSAAAVGPASIEVQDGATLEIQDNWTTNTTLTVADTSGAVVNVGSNEWMVSSLVLGGTALMDKIYTMPELNALGNAQFSGTGRITVGTPTFTQDLIAGWDDWSSNTAPVTNVTASGITATATASTATGSWSIIEDSSSGRGSSGDTTWGSFDGNGSPASSVTTGTGANMTALNAVTTAEVTLTITNTGAADWNLDAFHMDVIAFRPDAPRTYELEVLSGDITNGVVFTSANDEINHLGGSISGNEFHDEIDISLFGLADSTLEAGGSAVIKITFSDGAGSGSGHHLFLDNVAVSGVLSPVNQLQYWRYQHFGTVENTGTAADTYDVNLDGENNLLEFATAQDPHAVTLVTTPVVVDGSDLDFNYTRSKAAIDDGLTFTVEWSDTLLPESWSTVGVIESIDPENPDTDEVEHRIATVPVGTEGKRFVRLMVTP